MDSKSQSTKSLLLLPVITSLILLAFIDVINALIISPIFLFARELGLISVIDNNLAITITLLFNLVLNISALLLIYFIVIKKYNLMPKQLSNDVNGYSITIKTYLSLFALIFILAIIFNSLIEKYFPNESLDTPYDSIFPSDLNYGLLNFFLITLLVVIMAPILEELIFRRFLIPLFEGTNHLSTTMAVTLSAIMFGLIHTEADIINGSIMFAIIHFSTAFVLGLGLGGVYIATRDIRFPILYHGINNGFALFSQFVLILFPVDQNNVNEDSTPAIILGSLIFVMFIAGIIFILLALSNRKKITHYFTAQFQGRLSNSNNITLVGMIILFQGTLFVILPYIESIVIGSQTWDIIPLILLNSIVPILVFLICFKIILSNKDDLFKISKISNESLGPYVDNRYFVYPTNNQPFIQTQESQSIVQSFCRSCGEQLPKQNDIRFCPKCGFKFVDD